MSELNNLTREEMEQGIHDVMHPSETDALDPAKERDDNCRSEFFMRARVDDSGDPETRAAVLRQINAALKTL